MGAIVAFIWMTGLATGSVENNTVGDGFHYAYLAAAIAKLREGVATLNAEGRARLLEAFHSVAAHFKSLFETLFEGGEAELRLTESDDPLNAGLEIFACPPGKRLSALSLMSGVALAAVR